MYIIIKGIPFEQVESAFLNCNNETYVDDYGLVDEEANDMRPLVEVDVDADDIPSAWKSFHELNNRYPSAEFETL